MAAPADGPSGWRFSTVSITAGPGASAARSTPSLWPDDSALLLVDRLVDSDPTPGHNLVRQDAAGACVRLQAMARRDRRGPGDGADLEELTFPEIAPILEIGEERGQDAAPASDREDSLGP